MPSTYVPARAVAPASARRRVRVSERVRELAMLLALAAPTALAQQAAPAAYEADMSYSTAGTGASAADKYAVTGSVDNVSGTASGGSFALTSGTTGMAPAEGSPSDLIFGNGFD